MTLETQFSKAVEDAKTLTKRPTNDELLKLYALYKQATDGDNTEERPSGFDFKAIAKHDAWEELKNIPKDQAMTDYVALVEELISKYA